MTQKGNMISTSSGKKSIMALSGMFFCFFLCTHLAGNLFIFTGEKGFNSYAENLHSLGPVITVIEIILAFLFIIHVITGLMLIIENYSARPVKYAVNKSSGGATIGSMSMPWTGLAILCFLAIHLGAIYNSGEITSVYKLIKTILQNNLYSGIYLFGVLCAAVHVSHGLWSAFQTLGICGEKYSTLIRAAGYMLSILFCLGFGIIPIYFLMVM